MDNDDEWKIPSITIDWTDNEWLNCITHCWCTYQGEREDFLKIKELFLANEHPHGTLLQCMGCSVEITWN